MPEPSPMMVQYQGVKDRFPGHLVLFRVGDFYETFGEDAKVLSRDAEVVLTGRQMDGAGHRVPLAGVPHHAVEGYLARLVRKGHRVVLVDQVEDAKAAKGLVRREVTRVVTPGTVLEETLLPHGGNNFLGAFGGGGTTDWCAALVDISTGETLLRVRRNEELSLLVADIATARPAEVLLPAASSAGARSLAEAWTAAASTSRTSESPAPLSMTELPAPWQEAAASSPAAAEALGRAAAYARATEPRILPFLAKPVWRRPGERMGLDVKTLRHLEITEPMNPGPGPSPTLLDVVNVAPTAAGRRRVESWITSPLADLVAVEARLDAVEALAADRPRLSAIASDLKGLGDLSRLTARIVARRGGPRDLGVLGKTLGALPGLRARLGAAPGSPELPPLLRTVREGLGPHEALAARLQEALREEAPATAKDGGVLRSEAFPELSDLREKEQRARDAMSQLERREAEATGIRTLKIGYTQVFGFYFDVTRPHLSKVPVDRWRRKQTLSTGERYTSEELAGLESAVLQAEERSRTLEAELYEHLLTEVDRAAATLQATSEALGTFDALATFARLAVERRWVRPHLHEGGRLRIRDGRHPILERTLGPALVPNDTELDVGPTGPSLLLLTGPNMAGKSTYMRQVGLLVVLAQAGSFVPAAFAEIGLVSSLHTRMGFTDDIGRGKSSFMVEMSEVAEILAHSDARSLVLLDEVGRGTSTSDGLALAWGVVKYLHDKRKARSLVATHYHALVELVGGLPAARNGHLAVREDGGRITFLRTLLPGGTEKSYGLHVAELAGLPPEVLSTARRTLKDRGPETTGAAGTRRAPSASSTPPSARYTQALFVDDPEAELGREVLRQLAKTDVEGMTPMQALNSLHEIVEKARGSPPRAPPPEATSETAR